MAERPFIDDITKEQAESAYRNISWEPDKRGESFRRDYDTGLEEFRASFITRIKEKTPERSNEFQADFEQFRAKYKAMALAYLGAKGRTASAGVVGPSKFPTSSNEKKMATEDRRRQDWQDFIVLARKAFEKKYFPMESPIIRSGEECAVERLEDKIERLERTHEKMKKANAIIRKGENVNEKLAELGFNARTIHEITHPDFAGRTGFSFHLTNSNAEIRRVKERIAAEKQRVECYKAGDKEYIIGDVKVLENVSLNRIQLFFPGKPEVAMREKLKSRGFHWSPTEGAWQRQLTNAAIYDTKDILKGE
jgi:hypothetical protein